MRISQGVFAISTGLLLIVASARPAAADIIFSTGNVPQDGQENIQFGAAHTGTFLTGFTNTTSTEVKFTGDGETLVAASAGAARIQAQDGAFNYLLFEVVGKAFDSLVLDIDATNSVDPGSVTFFATNQFNVTESATFALSPTGNNFFTITTDALQVMTKLWFTSNSAIAFVDVAQFRVVTANLPPPPDVPIPEPGSMLLLGTGLAGLAAARRRRRAAR